MLEKNSARFGQLVMLTADAFGAASDRPLTPLSDVPLLSGYTAKSCTETRADRGTFVPASARRSCRVNPSVYGNLLKERIATGGSVLVAQYRLDRR